jgi:hypothetical protein
MCRWKVSKMSDFYLKYLFFHYYPRDFSINLGAWLAACICNLEAYWCSSTYSSSFNQWEMRLAKWLSELPHPLSLCSLWRVREFPTGIVVGYQFPQRLLTHQWTMFFFFSPFMVSLPHFPFLD